MIRCSKCGKDVEFEPGECEFCSQCGAPLNSNATIEPEGGERKNADFSALFSSVFAVEEQAKKSELAAEEKKTKKLPSSVLKPLSTDSIRAAEETEDSPTFNSSDCPYLKIEYNRNLYFLRGAQGTIKLRLTPKSGELRELLLFMIVEQGTQRTQKQIPVQEILTVGRPFQLVIPYCPENISGMLAIGFRVGCKTLTGLEYFQFSLEFRVFDPKQEVSPVGNISIQQNISATGAADIVYRDNLGNALQSLADKTAPSVHTLISRMNAQAPDFTEIALTRTAWTPEQSFIKGQLYITDRLVIECNGFRFVLVNKKNVKFGRSSEHADVIVHAGGMKLSARDYPNNTVSRLHAEVVYCEDAVNFFDHSSYGTYINGRKPDSAGIPIQDHALVEFGDIHWQMELQHCIGKAGHYVCQTCPAKKIKSMTFSRKDGEKEYYLLIWQCCELGRLHPDLADWTIFVRDGCFFVRTPDQNFLALRPGQDIEYKQQKIHVTFF